MRLCGRTKGDWSYQTRLIVPKEIDDGILFGMLIKSEQRDAKRAEVCKRGDRNRSEGIDEERCNEAKAEISIGR